MSHLLRSHTTLPTDALTPPTAAATPPAVPPQDLHSRISAHQDFFESGMGYHRRLDLGTITVTKQAQGNLLALHPEDWTEALAGLLSWFGHGLFSHICDEIHELEQRFAQQADELIANYPVPLRSGGGLVVEWRSGQTVVRAEAEVRVPSSAEDCVFDPEEANAPPAPGARTRPHPRSPAGRTGPN